MLAAVFGDFPKNKRNFLHKNKLYILWRIQFSVQHPTKSVSPGAVATTALWKLAPMLVQNSGL